MIFDSLRLQVNVLISWQSTNLYLKLVFFFNHWIRRKNVFYVYIYHLDPWFQVIELQYWSNIRRNIVFTINIIKLILNIFVIHTNISTIQPVHVYFILKKERSSNHANSCIDYFIFYNKNVSLCKSKAIFLSISFFPFYVKIKCT